jgi:nucleoside-diphosphate-sugar epimerase
MTERFLVTGTYGCLGAWTARLLLEDGVEIVGLDRSRDDHRVRLVLDEDQQSRLRVLEGDISEPGLLARLVETEAVTHIVHLAALQIPFCRADPPGGAAVNVTGTVNVFEAARANSNLVRGLAYASSAAVLGPPDLYPPVIDDSALTAPTTLYGAFKVANEWTARVYAADHGVGSVGLRPFVVYGPGRDQGMTSSPTAAMQAAASGEAFHISYGGRTLMQFAPDVARAFIAAARSTRSGEAAIHNLGGTSASMEEIVAAIDLAAPESKGKITYEDAPLPFPSQVDSSAVDRRLDGFRYTPLKEGVSSTVHVFKRGSAETDAPSTLPSPPP